MPWAGTNLTGGPGPEFQEDSKSPLFLETFQKALMKWPPKNRDFTFWSSQAHKSGIVPDYGANAKKRQ